MSISVSETTSPERFTGRVKWFNNKAGYGFVTVTDGPKAGSDIFIHHSSIKVDSEQYKYLVPHPHNELHNTCDLFQNEQSYLLVQDLKMKIYYI